MAMRLDRDLMVRLHRSEVTQAEAWRLQRERGAAAARMAGDTSEPGPVCAYTPFSPTGDLGAEYNRTMERLGQDEWALFVDHDAMMLTNQVWDDLRRAIREKPAAGAIVCFTNRTGNRKQKAKAPPGDDIRRHSAYAEALRRQRGFSLTDVTGDELTGVWFATSRAAWERAGGFVHGFGEVDNSYAKALRRCGLRTWRLDGTYVYHQRRTNGWRRETAPEIGCRKTGWSWQQARDAIAAHAQGTVAELFRAHCEVVEPRTDWGECQKNARRKVVLDAWRATLRISVCIPAREEEPGELAATVASFRAAGAHEILVADDGSRVPVAADCGADRVIRHAEALGVAPCRNELMREAAGTVVVFSDSHCRVAEGCDLRAWAWRALCSEDLLCAVCGSYEDPEKWFWGCSLRWDGARFDVHANRAQTERPAAPFGSVYAAARWTWERIGGWVPTRGWGYNEQALGLACHAAGTAIVVDGDFRIRHKFRNDRKFPYPVRGSVAQANAAWTHRLVFGEGLWDWFFRPAAEAERWDEPLRLAREWGEADGGATLARYGMMRRVAPREVLRRIGHADLVPPEPTAAGPVLDVPLRPQAAAPERAGGMVSPAQQKIIQINIGGACQRACSNCTQMVGHAAPFEMEPAMVRRALEALRGYGGTVGIFGAEPTAHSRFAEIVADAARLRPETAVPMSPAYAQVEDWERAFAERLAWRPGCRKGLWSGLGPGFRRHYAAIMGAFPYLCVNQHVAGCRHMALLLDRRELGVADAEWEQYRDRCWLQREWSAVVMPDGFYFCEVAAARKRLFGGPDGWPVEPGMHMRTPREFGSQLELCEGCSACLPVPWRLDRDGVDQVTPGVAARLRELGSRKAVEVVTATWAELKARHHANLSVEPYLQGTSGRRIGQPCGLEVGEVTGVVTCFAYDDYLALTLPRMVQELGRVIVVTGAGDLGTQDVARRCGAEVFLASSFAEGRFPKGRGLRECLATLPAGTWVVHVDADIALRQGWGDRLRRLVLHPDALYYTERVGPPLADWQSAQAAARLAMAGSDWAPLVETFGDRLYRQAAPWGFLQVVNMGAAALAEQGARYPGESAGADVDDAILARDWFGAARCVRLEGEEWTVCHLPHGVSRTNWAGRESPRIDRPLAWMVDREVLWRTSWRSGTQFAGLWQLTQEHPLPDGAVVVELGTMLGDSAAIFAAAYPRCRVITVDPGPTALAVAEAGRRLAVWPNVERWPMTSAEAARRVRSEGLRVALLYADAGHSEREVLDDLELWADLADLVAGHDFNGQWPGVVKAVDRVFGRPEKTYCDDSWVAPRRAGSPIGAAGQ